MGRYLEQCFSREQSLFLIHIPEPEMVWHPESTEKERECLGNLDWLVLVSMQVKTSPLDEWANLKAEYCKEG